MDKENTEYIEEIKSVVPGWFSDEDISCYRKLAKNIHNGIIIEVGSYLGRSALSISDICRENNNKLYCVDTWEGSPEHQEGQSAYIHDLNSLYDDFISNIKKYKYDDIIIPIRMRSVEASEYFKKNDIKADMVFIDAEHSYESVFQDIGAWRDVLNVNAILCGHDVYWDGIQKALNDQNISYDIEGSIWIKRYGANFSYENQQNKAIIFTAYNRPEYLIETLNSWEMVNNIHTYDVYFKIEPSDKIEQIKNIIENFYKNTMVKGHIILNESLTGCNLNTWEALSVMFDKMNYDFVILAEDDITVSNDVCDYFNYLGPKYSKDKDILGITAHFEVISQERDIVFRLQWVGGYVWGTWKDKWEKYLKNTWDKDGSTSENGGPHGWDWNIALRIIPKYNLYYIAPKCSRSRHIGCIGTNNPIHSPRDADQQFEKEYMGEYLKEVTAPSSEESNIPPPIEIQQNKTRDDKNQSNLIGAFYYAWYRKNWLNQCFRYTQYSIEPYLGEYNSLDINVISEHAKTALKYGIDFFIVSFNGEQSIEEINKVITVLENTDLKFVIHYESVNIFGDPVPQSEDVHEKIKQHFNIIKEFANSKSYLKLKNKPVFFIYTSRRILDLKEIDSIRETVVDCIIVGDEIWWGDTEWVGNENRIKKFDYIYGYNLYTPDKTNGNKKFVGDDYLNLIEPVYENFYKKARNSNVGLIPNIMPRYNDSSVRKNEGHYPIPPIGTYFFEQYFKMATKYFIGSPKILVITSFNEWYEDTQIEQTKNNNSYTKDSYDANTDYADLYLKKVLEFKNALNGADIKYSPKERLYKKYIFGEYMAEDRGSIFYFMNKHKDPVFSLYKYFTFLHIYYHNGQDWKIIKTQESCDENFIVEINIYNFRDIIINGKNLWDIIDFGQINCIYDLADNFVLHNPKYPEAEPQKSRLKEIFDAERLS